MDLNNESSQEEAKNTLNYTVRSKEKENHCTPSGDSALPTTSRFYSLFSNRNPEKSESKPNAHSQNYNLSAPTYLGYDNLYGDSWGISPITMPTESVNFCNSRLPFQSSPDSKSPDYPQIKTKTKVKAGKPFCEFCKNNNEEKSVYMSHVLKDLEGRVVCPVLYNYTCPICNNSGPDAHTRKHCPYDPEKLNKQRELAQSLAQLTLKGKRGTTSMQNTFGSAAEKNREKNNSLFVGSRIHEDDEVDESVFKEGIELKTNLKHTPSSSHSNQFQTSFDISSNSLDEIVDPYLPGSENQNEEIQTNQNLSTCNVNDSSYLKNYVPQDDRASYLTNLRSEFKDMPVMMFYNLVRLWHVQQAMSDTDHYNN